MRRIERGSDPEHRVRLLDAQEVLDTLGATSRDAIIVLNANDGTVLRWNPAAEQLLGYRASEIIGRPVFVLEPKGHQGEIHTNLTLVRRGVVLGPRDTERLRKDGTTVPVTILTLPIRNENSEVPWAVDLVYAP